MISIGDMAQHLMLQRQNVALRTDAADRATEVATGQVADPRRHLGGHFGQLAAIETTELTLAAYSRANAEAATTLDAAQIALDRVSQVADEVSSKMINAANIEIDAVEGSIRSEIIAGLDSVLAALNVEVAGRSVFAGSATDQRPLIDADSLVDAASAAMAGSVTPEDARDALAAWFAAPDGFAAVAYNGAPAEDRSAEIADGIFIDLPPTALAPELSGAIEALLLGLQALDPDAGFDRLAKREILLEAGAGLRAAQSDVIAVQADLGVNQARSEAARAQTEAERLGLDTARSALLAVDPYEAATALETTQFRLESLYTVTARLSRLSLAEYLR